jgi:hypothetical protein
MDVGLGRSLALLEERNGPVLMAKNFTLAE